MFGAIIGDMVGSVYESHSCKTKKFDIYNLNSRMTDDSYLTLTVAKVLMEHYPLDYSEESLKTIQEEIAEEFVNQWNMHKTAGFGGMFYQWCFMCSLSGTIEPAYHSFGNGSAMRISPVGWVSDSEEHVKLLSKMVTEITHDHKEGIKGAEAIAMAIYLALHGYSKEEIGKRMIEEYYPSIQDLNFDELVENYTFNTSCQKSVPQAIYCFLISDGFEDAIRNCIAIGGDTDTIAAMAGAIAEAYYQKDSLSDFEQKYLYFMIDPGIEERIKDFYHKIGSKKFEKK